MDVLAAISLLAVLAIVGFVASVESRRPTMSDTLEEHRS